MKGTAPRGRTPAEDDEQLARLLGSEKERAENLMIVDLLRNDLGQLAEIGSVQVPALFTPERYETVWQLTSDVTARPRAGTGLVDVFRALFPSGSVTGAPKHRTMQLIRELEHEPRGVYCGAVGIVAPPGHDYRASFNVAIRTVSVDRATGTAVFGTGGGITWGSDAAAEHAELLAKAAILAEPYEEFDLFETMAHVRGEGLRHRDRHLARMAASAGYFGFPFDEGSARALLSAAVDGGADARVRLVLRRDGSLDVESAPLPAPPPGPVRLVVDPDPVDGGSRWLRHKTTRRSVFTDRAARHPTADDVVLVNVDGLVTETTIANLAVRLDGHWWTPSLAAGCLPGVERGRLVELGQLAERELTPDDVRRATGLAVVNSLRGWRPAVLS
jgi:para-aminobenzoate synthetase/4-amino-4-deoxychorismate lyase